MSDSLVVNEIYLSLQGESTFGGLPCVFIRLTACNLRCSYCDTAYAFSQGQRRTLAEVRAEVLRLSQPFQPGKAAARPQASRPETRAEAVPGTSSGSAAVATADITASGIPGLPLVELTGGEPLLQKASLPLMSQLCDDGFTVLLETSGAHDISCVDPRVRRIMDLKCPSSGEAESNRMENLTHLKSSDEIKFVIGSREDYEWTKRQIAEHNLAARCPLLVSWVHPLAPGQQDASLKPVSPGHTPISRQELAERIVADALPVRFQIQMHKIIWPPDQRGV